MTDLSLVAQQFQFPATIDRITPYGSGIINDTYVVVFANPPPAVHPRLGKRAILQRINSAVFPQPEKVMHNLQRILQHAEQKSLPTGTIEEFLLPPVYLTHEGQSSFRDAEGHYWRALGFIEQTETHDVLQGIEQAYEVGVALGAFHLLVSDIALEQLYDTLPGFHITPAYLEAYDKVLTGLDSNAIRQDELAFCMQFVAAHRELAGVLINANPPVVQRIMHGDPKLNNVLFDKHSGKAVSIIDLDTVKPGLIQLDLGDCIRSCCNRSGEMPDHIEDVEFDVEACRAILQGYMSSASAMLQQQDIQLIYDAICLLPFELGLRFLTDYLQGNRYFKVSAPEDNLYRARVQFRLLQSIEQQEQQIRGIVKQVWLDVCG